MAETLDLQPSNVRIAHSDAIAAWTVEIDYGVRSSVSNTTTYGTQRFHASSLIEHALNGRTPTAYDEHADGTRTLNQQETIAAREKQQQLKDRFREWVWQDSARATRLARDYNDRFNNLRLRTFDGSHLTLPGMARELLRDHDLARHQKNAVWRILQSGSTLLAHVVGAGKTWTMAAAVMELRRMGLAKKPMLVVPNHLVEQWGAAFLQLYPHAKLFVATKDHFANGNRQRAMARIATGNYDAVIVSHRSFEFLPVSDKLFNRFIDDQVQQLENAILEAKAESGDDRRIVKELEKAKKRLVAKLKKRADRESKDDALTFEELGVDQLFVDEADLYKNLFYTTKMSRIAGLPNSDSNRAFDMFMKTRYVREIDRRARRLRNRHADFKHHGRDVHLASLSGSGASQGARRRAFRRLGGEFRRSGDGARTCSRRLGLPDAHALCQIRQPAGIALDVPHRRRRADRRHAESAAPEA